MSIGKARKVKLSTYTYFSNMENRKGTQLNTAIYLTRIYFSHLWRNLEQLIWNYRKNYLIYLLKFEFMRTRIWKKGIGPIKSSFIRLPKLLIKYRKGTYANTSMSLEKVTCVYPLKAYRSKLDKATRKSCETRKQFRVWPKVRKKSRKVEWRFEKECWCLQ